MTTKTKVILAIVALAASFALGRYTVPTKIEKVVEIREIVKEVEKKESKTDTQRNKRKETITTVTEHPDGRKVTETRVIETTETDKKSQSGSTTVTESEKESKSKEVTERSGGKVSIAVLGGVSPTNWASGPSLGGHVQKEILGPVTAGAFYIGTGGGVGGLSLGLNF
jgi:septal ring factor EnvC (AmiA/AmiB activator)